MYKNIIYETPQSFFFLPQNITVSCTILHIRTTCQLAPSYRISLRYFFVIFFHHFMYIFFLLFLLFYFLFALEIYKNRLCTICCSHRLTIHLCDTGRVHTRINYSKRNFVRLHSFFERGHTMEKSLK